MADLSHKLLKKTQEKAGARTRRHPVRIALSVLCIGFCLIVFILWIRSYEVRDSAGWQVYGTRMIRVFSKHGKLEFETYADMGEQGTFVRSLSHHDISAAWKAYTSSPEPKDFQQWRWEVTSTGRRFVYTPHWFLFSVFAALAAAPWFSWRFGLRTLLIVTTLVAALLGLLIRFG